MDVNRFRESLPTVGVVLLSGAVGVAGSYGVAGFRPSFLVVPIAGFMAWVLPGQIITSAIVVLGDLGDQLNLLMAFALAVGLLALTSLLGVLAGRRLESGLAGAALAVVLGTLVTVAVTQAPAPSVGAGLVAGAVVAAGELGRTLALPLVEGVFGERRHMLGSLAGAVGVVVTVAKFHVVNHRDGVIEVAGHYYAGTRGIDRVEVSTDGGDTWTEATLSEPLPGEDVWRQWAFEYDPPGETHEVVVRATDGTGQLQPSEESSPFPNGPSGWVSRSVNP